MEEETTFFCHKTSFLFTAINVLGFFFFTIVLPLMDSGSKSDNKGPGTLQLWCTHLGDVFSGHPVAEDFGPARRLVQD